jgi:hypothetical protein
MTSGGSVPPPLMQLPLASSAEPGAHGPGGDATGPHAPFESRNSPLPHGG